MTPLHRTADSASFHRAPRLLRALGALPLIVAVACGGGASNDDDGEDTSDDPGASGGAPSGNSGGVVGSGGVPGAGGVGTGGDPLAPSGGAGSGGGATGGTGTGGETAGGMSAGCGATTHPESGDYSIEVNAKIREYTLDVPEDYDPNTPYAITFGLHWRYGNSGDVVGNGYYGLKSRSNGTMIFVSPEGLVPGGVSGWANEGGEDVEFIALMLDRLEEELCIDTERVFATGFSYGGMFSNAIGCALADRFRAIAPYSGSLWSGCEAGTEGIAYLGTHGVQDGVVEIAPGRQARDEFISRNGCSTTSTSYGTNGCVKYDDCAPEHPLIWCEFTGEHWTPDFAADEVWSFFSGF